MDNQKLSKWASIAEITSSVAILATLVFLVIEIRQNNRLIEQNTSTAQWTAVQSLNESVQGVTRLWINDLETVALLKRGNQSYTDLSESEKSRCKLLSSMAFLTLDIMWYAYQDGILPEPLWAREMSFLKFQTTVSSCGREAWSEAFVSQPFRDYVESHVIGSQQQ